MAEKEKMAARSISGKSEFRRELTKLLKKLFDVELPNLDEHRKKQLARKLAVLIDAVLDASPEKAPQILEQGKRKIRGWIEKIQKEAATKDR